MKQVQHSQHRLDACNHSLWPQLTKLQEEGNLEAAIQCFQMALSIDVHCAKASLLLGVLYRQRGRPHDLTLAQVCSQSLCASWCTLRCKRHHFSDAFTCKEQRSAGHNSEGLSGPLDLGQCKHVQGRR